MGEYLDRFERCYDRVVASSDTAKILEEIRAFMVLERADVSNMQRMLILLKTNLEEETTMFSNMCKELKLVLGAGPGQAKANVAEKDEKATND